ncbi:hypothetical protein A3F03_03375 [Candidatus Roizmanbacteria bacterium RIFCSPHIGHO2_12_FULL_41_11]|uniref:Uncharacterized protein n=2 Tax=Candidatus Roizmaniibacteriota TaxID=1752723 RepID=A0A1F7J7P3_9BACT|nr:MAG: hypothetical protein A3F03_03375 [Candidatus Roizmanbacteria bacterium RIFCSPHIGHO2_12_FULL_41_11]OGK51624.1 MAG: hypothetical protein A2966_01095 [Candidatus Roizmanbacteria bacterium RIFCSPLOWO2_01_FULL_41_22]
MQSLKTIFLILGIVVLISGIIYITIQLQDASKSTGVIQTRADENSSSQEEPSPAPSVTAPLLAAGIKTASPTPSSKLSPTPTFGSAYSASPTSSFEPNTLPVAGNFTSFIPVFLLLSGLLIFSAFLF